MKFRTLTHEIRQKAEKLKKSVLLLGPRQVGKSTLLGGLSPTLSINLADEVQFRSHLKDPHLLRRQVEANGSKGFIFIDEVQRIPSILNTVQALIDEKKFPPFLLSGSSARKLRAGQANLLPGRIFSYELFPLSFWELENDFNLEKALTVGTLPEVYLAEYGPELLRNYIDTYLREEIKAEGLVRDVGTYARFLDLSSAVSGQVINYSALASDSEIPKESLRRFFDILTDTLIVHKLGGYQHVRAERKASQKDKFIFFDLGVRNGVLGQEKNHFTETELGPLFEQWLVNQVQIHVKYHQKNWSLHYYRDDKKEEVDLIIDCGKRVVAVEVKFATKVKENHLEGLKAFAQVSKKPCSLFLVFRGEKAEKWGEVLALPYRDFLTKIGDWCEGFA
jgi:predicted AAA+ superfamily ATPase